MKYRATESFIHASLGRVAKGQIVELANLSGVRRFVEPVEPVETAQVPKPKPAPDSLSSPAAPVSQPKTSRRSRKPAAQ